MLRASEESLERALRELESLGFALLPKAVPPPIVEGLIGEWERRLPGAAAGALLRTEAGAPFGSRNVLDFWPEVIAALAVSSVRPLLDAVFGPRFGVVRVLFFDKPPERSWTLPWHKDLTIQLDSRPVDPSTRCDSSTGVSGMDDFGPVTIKRGIPHIEAPARLLQRMLSLRLHLDEQTSDNGPLKVIPGSHRDGKRLGGGAAEEQLILGPAGSILAMRPLLTHASGHTRPGVMRHRRVLQFELAADPEPGAGLAWRHFRPLD